MSSKKIILICLGILLAGILITSFIFISEPAAKQEGATRVTAMLVEVIEADYGDFKPLLTATGTVQPVEDVMLSPLVGGQVIRRSPAFTPGNYVKKGDLLLQIDPADYQNTLRLREGELMQRKTELDLEMGRQQVAQQDLALVGGDSLSPGETSLVLREPQLQSVEAAMNAASSAVDQARLNLSRTSLRAPFDAHILSQNVTEGSQVAPGDNLGRIVGTDFYWVVVELPVSRLRWLQFPDSESEKGSLVRLYNKGVWAEGQLREAEVYRQVGALDEQTRLVRVLVRVPDPLGLNSTETMPKLMIGAFVDAEIEAGLIEGVIRLPRQYLRSNQTVWVMNQGKLEIREVSVELIDDSYAYIRSGLEAGEKVVTTNLSTVAEGLSLRTEGQETEAGMQDE